jgi:hypothetical protein
MRNDEPISIRVSREIKQAAKKAAEADHRSVASLASIALVEFLQRKGLLPLPKKATK